MRAWGGAVGLALQVLVVLFPFAPLPAPNSQLGELKLGSNCSDFKRDRGYSAGSLLCSIINVGPLLILPP